MSGCGSHTPNRCIVDGIDQVVCRVAVAHLEPPCRLRLVISHVLDTCAHMRTSSGRALGTCARGCNSARDWDHSGLLPVDRYSFIASPVDQQTIVWTKEYCTAVDIGWCTKCKCSSSPCARNCWEGYKYANIQISLQTLSSLLTTAS